MVCKHSDIMYASVEQFSLMLNEACGRSNDGENWNVPEIVAENWCLCQGAGNGSFGLAWKKSVLHCSHMRLILQKITVSI